MTPNYIADVLHDQRVGQDLQDLGPWVCPLPAPSDGSHPQDGFNETGGGPPRQRRTGRGLQRLGGLAVRQPRGATELWHQNFR